MLKARRELIIGAFILSGIAISLQLVSIGTEQWIVSEARTTTPGTTSSVSEIKYGLFNGVFKYNIGGYPVAFEITITCLIENNVCAYLCGYTSGEREKVLQNLYDNEGAVEFNPNSCPRVAKSYDVRLFAAKEDTVAHEFINSGLYISSLVFLMISAIFGLISALLTLWNAVTNPINHFLSIFGIHIYNGIAIGCVILGIALYGALYVNTLSRNVCVQTTITGDMTSDGYATLGFSYWLNLGSLILYIVSDVMLYLRNILINREPKQITIDEVQDPGLILF